MAAYDDELVCGDVVREARHTATPPAVFRSTDQLKTGSEVQLPSGLLKFWVDELQVQLPKIVVSAAAFSIAPMKVRLGK
jgi:hypothetical protein